MRLSSSEIREALKVVCPHCGAWIKEKCTHTKGSKRGKECDLHPDRIKLSQIDLSPDTKKKIKEVEEAVSPSEVKKAKKDKLPPDQRLVADTILQVVSNLGKNVEFVHPVTKGPLISTYRVLPIGRTRVNHLEGMWKDFAVALGAETLVVKRMPGESAVGVFVPNKERQILHLQETLKNVIAYMQNPLSSKGHRKIPLNFGITAQGDPFVDDLAVQPHILLAGSTDSGKTTLALALLLSMAFTMSPRELQIAISDTKKVDFKPYFGSLPHLWGQRPIAGDRYETMQLLEALNRESDRRLNVIARANTRNIHEFNRHVEANKDKPKDAVLRFENGRGQITTSQDSNKLPFIVLYIDEMADIMGEQVDRGEAKLNSQKLGALVGRCRAAGIYVICGTQRSSVNIIKGSIKANFPSRVAFRLPSQTDSRTIISTKGAENLMSHGDMFYQSSQSSELLRLHSPFTELPEVKSLLANILQKEELEKAKLNEEKEERTAIQEEGSGGPMKMWNGKPVN